MSGRVDLDSIVSRDPLAPGPVVPGSRFEGATPDEVFRAYEARVSRRLDPRARASQLLQRWVTRVREALGTWSPV